MGILNRTFIKGNDAFAKISKKLIRNANKSSIPKALAAGIKPGLKGGATILGGAGLAVAGLAGGKALYNKFRKRKRVVGKSKVVK